MGRCNLAQRSGSQAKHRNGGGAPINSSPAQTGCPPPPQGVDAGGGGGVGVTGGGGGGVGVTGGGTGVSTGGTAGALPGGTYSTQISSSPPTKP